MGNLFVRGAGIVGGLLLTVPEIWTDMIGIVISACVIVICLIMRRRETPATAPR